MHIDPLHYIIDMIIFKVAFRCFPATIDMHVLKHRLKEYNNTWRKNNNKARVLQYFNIYQN